MFDMSLTQGLCFLAAPSRFLDRPRRYWDDSDISRGYRTMSTQYPGTCNSSLMSKEIYVPSGIILNLKHLFCESIKWKYFYKTAVFLTTGSCFNTYLFLLFQYKGLVMHSLQGLPLFPFQALLEAM